MFGDRIRKLEKKASANLDFMANFVDTLVDAESNADVIEQDADVQMMELEAVKEKAAKAKLFSKKLLKILGE